MINKKMGILILLVLFVSVEAMAQSKPFNGYDKVAWGVSATDIRKEYSIGEEVVAVTDDKDPNIVSLWGCY